MTSPFGSADALYVLYRALTARSFTHSIGHLHPCFGESPACQLGFCFAETPRSCESGVRSSRR